MLLPLALLLGACGDGGGEGRALDATPEDSPSEEVSDADGAGEDSGEEVDGDVREVLCIFDDDCDADGEICVNAQCVAGCRTDAECEDNNRCTERTCRDGQCQTEALDGPLPDDRVGDCRRPACVDGVETYVASSDDTPPPDPLVRCVEWRCVGTTAIAVPNDELCRDGDPATGEAFCVPDDGCRIGEMPAWVCPPFDPGYQEEEVCGNGQDDNGSGLVDEGCPCTFGEIQRCFPGPPNSRGVGQCRDGYQQCIDRENPRWGPCVGAILPSREVCDNRDNRCNGCVDDIPACEPVVNCPGTQIVEPFRTLELDATTFFGEEIEEVVWSVLAPANSNTPGPVDPNAPQTSVFLDVSGDYQISVTLEDTKGDSFACSWIVSAQGSGLRAELRWDTFGDVDLDLHMHRSGVETGFCTSDDCYFANCRSNFGSGVNWGYPASPGSACRRGPTAVCPNPRLDIDNIRVFDPENINLDNPRDGDRFRYMVHMYGGGRATRPVLTIYCGGGLAAVLGEAPDEVVMTRAGGGCRGHTWRAADVTVFVDDETGAVTCQVAPLFREDGSFDLRVDDSSY